VKCDEVKGNASVTHSRGKPRYLYEYSFELDIEVVNLHSSSKSFSGVKIKVIDAINDQLDDMELELQWGDKRPDSAGMTEVKATMKGDVRSYILKQLQYFETEFRKI